MNDRTKTRSERVKELTDKLEAGIAEVFASENYAAFLKTMSKFHRYSFRNSLLIHLQCPTATYVAGYHDWKRKFGRQVRAGARGITILAPCSRRQFRQVAEEESDDETTTTIKLVQRQLYRTATVFDISQTEGRELPAIAHELCGDVARYDEIVEALRGVASVPIIFTQLLGGVRGAYIPNEKRIVIRQGMSHAQTVKTLIHEIAHSRLHGDTQPEGEEPKDRNTREVEAESVAYVVCRHFGIDTSDYSFGYVAGWSKSRELPELTASLETIRSTAAEMIDSIERAWPPRWRKRKRKNRSRQEYEVSRLRDKENTHGSAAGAWGHRFSSCSFNAGKSSEMICHTSRRFTPS